jgi:hypothetical protein
MANFPEYNLKFAIAFILCFEGFKGILLFTDLLKKQKRREPSQVISKREKPLLTGERFYKTIQIYGCSVQVEIFIPDDLRQYPGRHKNFAIWISNSIATFINTGVEISKVFISTLSETEAICTYYDAHGAEISSQRISTVARYDAYTVGKTYIEQMAEKGTYDPRVLTALQNQLEKKYKNSRNV